MTLVLKYVARSDRGLVRSNNQDSVYAGPRLLAVADGMGGYAGGEVASKIVIAALAPLDDDDPGEDLLNPLREAVLAGNAAISELVANDPELDGMGTTLTAILFAGNRLGVVNIGDSRTYLMRGGQVAQITHDDSFVQSLIDEGRITPEEANSHPQRSLLLRALTGHEVEPSLTIREARAGDRYLLCSDGLSSYISHETLTEAIRIQDPQDSADRMIELALKAGGPDNVTVIIADVIDVDFGEDDPIVGGAAGDGSDEAPQPDSPASRARALHPVTPPPQRILPGEQAEQKPKRRRWLRALIITLIVLVVLGGGAFGTRYWVLSQYYVGASTNSEIAIFQGVRGSVLGVALNREVQGSCTPGAAASCEAIRLDDLNQSARLNVQAGIPATSLGDAQATLQRLRTQQVLPECPKPTTTPTSTPPQTGTNGSPTTGTRTTTAVPPTTGTSGNASSGIGSNVGSGTATPPTTSYVPPVSHPQPGIDCRKPGS
ncbi:MAG TPA: protein phosphatase 2C domain-containing protein [Pseudonocardiaceae bacterium]|jgi:serine/threonine protein phosphatase PrpC|nr:protein phosphatase 2C domain-containing protein [Pseudonocardiaceae bacterium]